MSGLLKKMRSPERLQYLPEPPRASEWEEEDEEENTDDAVICWPKEPDLVVQDVHKKEEIQNGMVLRRNCGVKGKGRLGSWSADADARRAIGDIELFVNEMLRRKDISTGANRKRKASVSRCCFFLFFPRLFFSIRLFFSLSV